MFEIISKSSYTDDRDVNPDNLARVHEVGREVEDLEGEVLPYLSDVCVGGRATPVAGRPPE